MSVPEAERVNILVVDDLPEKLLAYEAILEELGQNLITVRSGEEALKLVLRYEFAVILLDVNMPGMNGFETASLIRQRKRSSHTPIIFLTAFTDEVRMAQGYASGAVDYLPTPVVPEILKAKVRVFIELSQMRRQAAARAEERAMRNAAEESARRSEFMVNASAVLASAPNEEAILRAMVQLPIPYLADIGMIWLVPTETRLAQMEWCWADSNGELCTQSLSTQESFPSFGLEAPVREVLQTGQAKSLGKSVLSRLSFAEVSDCMPSVNNGVLLPLIMQNRPSGVLFLARKSAPVQQFSDIALGVDLITRGCIALEKTLLMERIKEADRRKDEFLAMLAHELRNPLAPIRNALHLMKIAKNDDMYKKAQETIERQFDHMIHLVDDLMDVSRITQGKIELRKEQVFLTDVLNQAIETATPLIKQRRHTLNVKLPNDPIWLNADCGRIAQIFSNLLNNAAKYTDEGGLIEIEVKPADQTAVIVVRDNGIGIPPAMLTHIFDLFSQVDSTLERAQGGLGIGLTLVKSLVELHGGTIEAHSEGKGSEFIVTLPTIPAKTIAADNCKNLPQEPHPSSIRVLVVDDSVDSAKTLGWMIEFAGHDFRLAHDGKSAIEIAKTYRPEVVLLDIGLPGMNGYEVCKTMRSESGLENTIFIAQTGWGQAEHRRRSKEAGFDHHLVKPVDVNALQHLINDIARAH
jgi:signal transduction histidine kinase/CheY-like chemotaxis protein